MNLLWQCQPGAWVCLCWCWMPLTFWDFGFTLFWVPFLLSILDFFLIFNSCKLILLQFFKLVIFFFCLGLHLILSKFLFLFSPYFLTVPTPSVSLPSFSPPHPPSSLWPTSWVWIQAGLIQQGTQCLRATTDPLKRAVVIKGNSDGLCQESSETLTGNIC